MNNYLEIAGAVIFLLLMSVTITRLMIWLDARKRKRLGIIEDDKDDDG